MKTGGSAAWRLELYGGFARRANAAGVRWAVLSGIEGYPESIGRDLDVLCHSAQDRGALLQEFAGALAAAGAARIVHPSPAWGARVLGISERFECAELHVYEQLRTGVLGVEPDWERLAPNLGPFPVDPLARFFKRCLMPAYARDPKWACKCRELAPPAHAPRWLRGAAQRLAGRGEPLAARDRAALLAGYAAAHPLAAARNLCRALARRRAAAALPTVPIFVLPGHGAAQECAAAVMSRLGELFLRSLAVDELSAAQVRRLQCRQQFLYLSRPRADLAGAGCTELRAEPLEALLDRIVAAFCAFNERWRPAPAAAS